MYDVITFGSATRDVILSSRHFTSFPDKDCLSGDALHLELGSKLEMEDVVFETGGGATNTAVTFARQGLKTAFVGKVGQEARGEAVLAQVKAEKVDTSLVIRDHDDPTGYSVILHTPEGERTVLVFRGASSDFKPSEPNWGKMKAKWFYITNLAGKEKYLKKILTVAKKNNTKIAINPGLGEINWGFKKFTRLLKDVDILILNKEEACSVTGCPASSNKKILEKICYKLPGIVVVTDGPRGAMVCDNQQHYFVGTHGTKPLDTLGAGDAFGSGFVAGYIKNKGDIGKSLQFGLANAESVIQFLGAKKGILRGLPKKLKPVQIDAKRANF